MSVLRSGGNKHWFIRAFFPEECVRCNEEGSHLCSSCFDSWEPNEGLGFCARCGEKGLMGLLCIKCKEETDVNALYSIGPYKDPVLKSLIQLWKYHYVDDAWEHLKKLITNSVQQHMSYFSNIDVIVPVPLHSRKMRQRGFDQSTLIAEHLSSILDIPIKSLLIRSKFTKPQAVVRSEDRGDTNRTFQFEILAPPKETEKNILLIDDVWTSGETMSAAAKRLTQFYRVNPHGFVIARGK